ncbi:hypothetical protein ACTJLC_24650 [Paraburkholderia sp. 22099]|uniref:hypothetical protein n=1 Tax=Paraburkholderia TaxID=1822464 RepID=UPI002863A145|nr:hypothetical protein [Paraburkholderia terricola]MDR6448782.1 hypothetical protein [Paraburkholderia terricola]MDR6494958.1 hypothetical protein [Paraburkholderia terricola]
MKHTRQENHRCPVFPSMNDDDVDHRVDVDALHCVLSGQALTEWKNTLSSLPRYRHSRDGIGPVCERNGLIGKLC